jgi:hypothetical protein
VGDQLLKMQKNGQFPDELVKIEGSQIHLVASQHLVLNIGNFFFPSDGVRCVPTNGHRRKV